ncbi:MAG: glycosyltransferase, partial [Fimbriimonadales bacterium]|nr:glycosyltransferase [Fimbriimonadales bacterium]
MSLKGKPRVLLVGPTGTPGGSETVTRVILNSPLSEKYDLKHFDITRKHGKEYIGQFTLQNAYWALRYLTQFFKTTKRFRPHIVHFPVASPKPALLRDWLFALITKRSGARLVLHNHAGDFDRRYRERGAFWKSLTRNYLSKSDALICLSPY